MNQELIERACDAVEDYCSDMPDLAGHGHSVGLKDALRAALSAPAQRVEEGAGDAKSYIRDWCPDVVRDYVQQLEERAAFPATLSAPAQRVEEGCPDDQAVDRFAAAMKAKLAKKRDEGRGGWWDDAYCNNDELSAMLRKHVEKGDPLDVGNLAMMLHQRGERIAASPAPAPHAGVEIDDAMVERAWSGYWSDELFGKTPDSFARMRAALRAALGDRT